MPVDIAISYVYTCSLIEMNFEGLCSSPCLGLSSKLVHLLHLSEPQLSHLENGDAKKNYLLRLVTVHEVVQVKCWPNA